MRIKLVLLSLLIASTYAFGQYTPARVTPTEFTAETNRAIAAEGVLQTNINVASNALHVVDTNLQEQITTETNRAYSIETNLQDQITVETNRAYSIETNLQDQITIETNRAYTAETNLQYNIEISSNALHSVETNLQDQITIETNRAYTAETNLQGQVTILNDNAMTNLVNAYGATGTASYVSNTLTITHGTIGLYGESNIIRRIDGTDIYFGAPDLATKAVMTIVSNAAIAYADSVGTIVSNASLAYSDSVGTVVSNAYTNTAVLAAAALPKTGGTMTGPIGMGHYSITNLAGLSSTNMINGTNYIPLYNPINGSNYYLLLP